MNSRSTPLYEALLHGAEVRESSLLPQLEPSIPTTPLPLVLNVQIARMGNLVGVKNWFLTSCYGLVVRMGSSLVSDWKGYIRKGYFRWRLLGSKVLVYWKFQESL